LPGHQIPETPAQFGAAEVNRIGRLLRFASAKPASNDGYQAIPESGWVCAGLDATHSKLTPEASNIATYLTVENFMKFLSVEVLTF
jgi:hypothetical protein